MSMLPTIQDGGNATILVIEDERKLAAAIAEGLQQHGYKASVAHTGETGLKYLKEKQADVVLLDLMLPKVSGLEVLREMRREGFRMPVLILTSKQTVDDRVRGLDAGADDYLVKPFAFPELLARIRALHRRAEPGVPTRLVLADLVVDFKGRTAQRAGQLLDLTEREFDLLEYLMLHQGEVVSREMVARDIWKSTMRYSSLDNVIDVHVARIRRKLDDSFPAKLLHTVRGVGFVMRSGEN